ncbi:syntaxin binding protein [Trypanosoma cruzi]|nr:syntaxin binding protein [Trypanosoma cruzi]
MPRPVRLRLLLLLVTASSTEELTEAKKQQLIRDGGLTPNAYLFASLEHVTRRAGSVQRHSTASAQSERSTSASASNAATDGDSFLKHACLLGRAGIGRCRLGFRWHRCSAIMRWGQMARMVAKTVEHEGITPGHFKGVVAKGRIILFWVAVVVVGRLPSQLLSALCCLFWVVWPAARGARPMRYPKGMAVRWSLGKPRCCVLSLLFAGTWHPTAL